VLDGGPDLPLQGKGFLDSMRPSPNYEIIYLSELLQPVAKLESRQRLRSPSTSQLVVPCTRRSIGDCAFVVAAPRAWNSLPDSLHKLSSFVNFKKHLKFDLFINSLAQHDI